MRYEIDAKEYQVTEINTTDEPCLQFLNEINAVTTNRFQIITNFEALMNYVKQTNKQNNKTKTTKTKHEYQSLTQQQFFEYVSII